jgi:hypothetical protein
MKSGVPPKFENLPEVDPAQVMIVLAKNGLTNEEIASFFGMSVHQFGDLLNKQPELREALEEAKEEPNFKVEQALFKRALGFEYKEIVQEDGRPIKVTLKALAPDPISCIFWLKNRDPKKWRDVIEHKFSLRDRMDRAHEAISAPKKKALGPSSEGEG